ncbi:hypothetical protein ELR70_16045 [Pseudoalteromonas sp. R3]|nr:hypothetical protein ELR70_16045 [Pseudoalteromonas sp. R3]
MSLLPMANAVSDENYVKEAKRAIAKKQLVGALNNTKWNELISEVREFSEKPCYRTKVVTGYISGWENEWHYHLPFPLLCVEWIDIDYSEQVLTLVKKIGMEFEATNSVIRIWGYFPKRYDRFGEEFN